MLSFRASLGLVLSSALCALPAHASRVHKVSTTNHPHLSANHARLSKSHSKRHPTSRGHRVRGQQVIEPDRVTEIQQALIREHYLNGDANGKWDATTQAAMQKYQADQGWQTKLMPDSRALKKMGLGADYSSAINGKTASFADPQPVSAIPSEQAAGFAAAAGTNR